METEAGELMEQVQQRPGKPPLEQVLTLLWGKSSGCVLGLRRGAGTTGGLQAGKETRT